MACKLQQGSIHVHVDAASVTIEKCLGSEAVSSHIFSPIASSPHTEENWTARSTVVQS